MKPYVICHMNASIDGRILAAAGGPPRTAWRGCSSACTSKLGNGSWLIGRVTGSEYAKAESYPDAGPGLSAGTLVRPARRRA